MVAPWAWDRVQRAAIQVALMEFCFINSLSDTLLEIKMTESFEIEILVHDVKTLRARVENLQRSAKIGNQAEADLAKTLPILNAKINELFELAPNRFTFRQDKKKGHEHLLIVTIDNGPKFRFPIEMFSGENKQKVKAKMNSKVKFVNAPIDLRGTTKLMVDFGNRLLTLEDAKVIWTSELRTKAMAELKARRPDLYARYKLATIVTYRDAQRYCSQITSQSYCEVREGFGSSAILTLFGGNDRGVYTETSLIPNIPGGGVQWYTHTMRTGGWSTGHETICRIVKPETWRGDAEEEQEWVDYVQANLDDVVERLKSEDDPQKQYFDVRHIPNLSNCSTRLGYSELSYN